MILETLKVNIKFLVWMAYRHNQGPDVELGKFLAFLLPNKISTSLGTPNHPPFIAVTACVDKINLQNRIIRSDLDIVMSGVVTWVGRSSMEITMHLAQKYDENDYRFVLVICTELFGQLVLLNEKGGIA